MTRLFSAFLSLILCTSCSFAKISAPKVSFVTQSCLVPKPKNKYKLCDNLIIHVDDEYIAVPRGFITDLASVPRVFWSVFWPTEYETIAPAILHDWQYCCDAKTTRLQADTIFYYGLIDNGVSRFKASIYYMAVRQFGGLFFQAGKGLDNHDGEFSDDELQGHFDDVNYPEENLND